MTHRVHKRIEVDEYFLKMARLASLRGACVRRQTGCVLVNSLNHVIATGYNGRARGINNCLERPCKGAESLSGTDLGRCEAIHAEANALLQCKDVEEITTAYCTTAPCIHCVKLLMNTGCSRILFLDDYPHSAESKALWTEVSYREWIHAHEQSDMLCSHQWAVASEEVDYGDISYLVCIKCGYTSNKGNRDG